MVHLLQSLSSQSFWERLRLAGFLRLTTSPKSVRLSRNKYARGRFSKAGQRQSREPKKTVSAVDVPKSSVMPAT